MWKGKAELQAEQLEQAQTSQREAMSELEAARVQVSEREAELSQAKASAEEAAAKAAELAEAMSQAEAQHDSRQQEMEAQMAELDAQKTRNEKLKERLAAMKDKANGAIEKARSKAASLEQEKQEELSKLEQAHADAVGEVSVWKGKAELQAEQLEQAQASQREATSELETARADLLQQSEQLAQLEVSAREAEEKVVELEAELARVSQAARESEAQAAAHAEAGDSLRSELLVPLAALEQRMSEGDERIHAAESLVRDLSSTITEQRLNESERTASLQEELAAAKLELDQQGDKHQQLKAKLKERTQKANEAMKKAKAKVEAAEAARARAEAELDREPADPLQGKDDRLSALEERLVVGDAKLDQAERVLVELEDKHQVSAEAQDEIVRLCTALSAADDRVTELEMCLKEAEGEAELWRGEAKLHEEQLAASELQHEQMLGDLHGVHGQLVTEKTRSASLEAKIALSALADDVAGEVTAETVATDSDRTGGSIAQSAEGLRFGLSLVAAEERVTELEMRLQEAEGQAELWRDEAKLHEEQLAASELQHEQLLGELQGAHMQLGDEASRCLTLETSLERARLTTAQDSARMKESDARITSLHEELAQAREEREQQELKMQIAKEESLTAQQGLELKLTMVAKEKAEVAKRHEELAAHSAEVEAGLQKAQQDSVNMQEEARAEHDKLQQRERELRATARAKHEEE